jgi:ClpP class serine protease
MQPDAVLFEDILRSVSDSKKGYLMLTSSGGDPNAAEKLLIMCRERFTEGFQVIVPNYAKSAATLICLGSDKILMGYMAELGPIDPQIQLDPFPSRSLPARSFIDGLESIRTKVRREGDPPTMYLSMLSQIRPEVIAMCQSAIDDSRATAEKWLKRYMLKDIPQQAERVADWLSNGVNYKSHGKVIDYAEAKDVLKLNAEKIDPNSELWNYIWELYVRSIEFMQRSRAAAKLFESETVSLTMNIELVQGPQVPAQRPPQGPTPSTSRPPPQAPSRGEQPS